MSTDWNQAYLTGETPWDKGAAAPPLRSFLARQPVQGKVLVPGCGSGHDVRLLAQQGATVIGLDIAAAAIEAAQILSANHNRDHPSGHIQFLLGDFLALPKHFNGAFDWVVEHTCLCALEPEQRGAYARSVVQALRPGGQFLAIFYQNIPAYDGDGPPHPISCADIEALFGPHFAVVQSEIPADTYPSRPAGAERMVWFRKHF